jgi:hypothetical protein
MCEMTDDENDERDGVLFGFWIKATSFWPSRLMQLMAEENKDGASIVGWRRALMRLAQEKGVNLP